MEQKILYKYIVVAINGSTYTYFLEIQMEHILDWVEKFITT